MNKLYTNIENEIERSITIIARLYNVSNTLVIETIKRIINNEDI